MQQIKITPTVTDRTAAVSRYMSDVNRYPMVTPKEEEELAFRIRAGDEEALRRLVEANLRFVISVAKQYQGHGMDLPDLINEGNVGLLKAARRFDPSKGFKFISYAVWWIRQSILQALADKSRMVRLPINQVNALGKMLKAGAVFLQENGREPSDSEIADLTGLSPDKTGDAARISGPPLSFDTPFGEDGDGTLLDVVPDGSCPSADSNLVRESLRSDLEDIMKVLAPREREVLRLSFGLGCEERTLEEIGEGLNLSRERVRQLREKAIRKMARPAVRSRLAQYL